MVTITKTKYLLEVQAESLIQAKALKLWFEVEAEKWQPRKVYWMDEDGCKFSLPRGFEHRLLKGLTDEKVPYRVVDNNSFAVIPPKQGLDGITLDSVQVACLEAMLSHDICSVQLATGSGKTEIILTAVMSVLDKFPEAKVLIVTSRKSLVRDILKRARLRLPHLVEKIGMLGDGVRDLKQITLSTSASSRDNERLLNYPDVVEWKKDVDVLILDEAHHSTSGSWKEVVTSTQPEYLWALSGKLIYELSDKPNLELERVFGRPVFIGGSEVRRVPVKVVFHTHPQWRNTFKDVPLFPTLVDGVPACYRVDGKWHEGVYHGLDADGRAPEWMFVGGKVDKSLYGIYDLDDQLLSPQPSQNDVVYSTVHDIAMMEFDLLNLWAADLTQEFVKAGEAFIISVKRSRHLSHLTKCFSKHYPKCRIGVVSGKLSGTKQLQVFQDLAEGRLDGAICQFQTASEGVDVPRLVHFLKLDGVTGEQALEQQKGRVERACGNKPCGYIHIPYGSQHSTLGRQAGKMLHYYCKIRKFEKITRDHSGWKAR